MVLLDIQVIGSRQIGTAGEFERQVGVVEGGQDVRNDGLFVDIDAENLTFLVDTNDTVCRLVLGRDEDGFTRDTIHVDTCTGFQVVEMDEAKLCHEVDDSMLFRNLHGHGEIAGCFWREINIDILLGEWWVRSLVVDFNDMKLYTTMSEESYGSNRPQKPTLAPVAVLTANVNSFVGF